MALYDSIKTANRVCECFINSDSGDLRDQLDAVIVLSSGIVQMEFMMEKTTNQYLLLTPGPLTTTATVRAAMLQIIGVHGMMIITKILLKLFVLNW